MPPSPPPPLSFSPPPPESLPSEAHLAELQRSRRRARRLHQPGIRAATGSLSSPIFPLPRPPIFPMKLSPRRGGLFRQVASYYSSAKLYEPGIWKPPLLQKRKRASSFFLSPLCSAPDVLLHSRGHGLFRTTASKQFPFFIYYSR